MATNMTREEFIAKYGPVFVADDKGGNAASEVAGQDVGSYYDMFLGPDARKTYGTSEGSQAWDNTSLQWGNGNYGTNNPNFDGFDNVNPHPESERLDGLGEFWKAVGKPLAAGAAMYGGINGLNSLMGPASGATATPVASSSVTGTALEPLAGTALNQTAAETARLAAMNAGTNTLGGIGASTLTAGAGAGSSILNAFKDAGSFLKDNSGLMQIGGALLGAAASGDTETKSSSSKDPWAPAQPYLLDNLKTNANMQEYYRANPFSTEQKTAYQGLLNTLANNQANAPGLLANANSFGQSSRGKMPAMQGLLSGTQAPAIDWAQYQNIGRK